MQFDQDFFTAIGLADAPDAEKQKLAEQLAELIQDRIAVRLGEVLTDEQGERFADLIDEGKEEEAFSYLSEVYPDYGQIVQEEMDRARDELVKDMQVAIKQFEEQDAAAAQADGSVAQPPADNHNIPHNR